MKYWRAILTIGCCIAVVACGDNSKIKDAVRAHLKDPESANFKEIVVSENGKRACTVWNAKNSMGGYGNWELAELTKDASEWKVNEWKGNDLNCSESGFKALDAKEIAETAAPLRAIEMLQKSRKISRSDAVQLVQSGDCKSLAWEYAYLSGLFSGWKDSDMPVENAKRLKDVQMGFEDGSCKRYQHQSVASAVEPAELVAGSGATSGIVVFEARALTWIEVVDAGGVVQVRRNMAAGEVVGVSSSLPLTVLVGRADTTAVKVRGEPFDVLSIAKDNVARFEVK